MSLGPPIRPPAKVEPERWEPVGKTGVFRSSKTGKTQTWIPANEVANGTAVPPYPALEPDLPMTPPAPDYDSFVPMPIKE